MTTTAMIDTRETATGAGRGQAIWAVVVQVVALGLTWLALAWAGKPEGTARLLLLLLTAVAVVVALVPAWRRGAVASVLGSVALGTAAWLAARAATHTFSLTIDDFPLDFPLIIPIVAGAAVLLAGWGVCVRGFADRSRLGVAALIGGVLVFLLGAFLFVVINYLPLYVKLGYTIAKYDFAGFVAMVLLYPAALWLGAAGPRPTARWNLLPLGLAVVLVAGIVLSK